MIKSPIIKQSFDLEERTLKFAKQVFNLCGQVVQNIINKEIISQVVRSSGSVGANYREANDAVSKKDFTHRMKIARKEAKETHYWLQLLEETNPALKNKVKEVLQEALELKKILSAIVNKTH
ncbi:MAG: hypothetical protein A2W61_07715 [Deltaproteobacteria bacterium RIFCSPLOWO2_01_44_7]|nr:MAG: hypothetical protein A2712_00345 [Deltaproteobacteria bacterium RIFCSPHIGHO2_01_FULL_43_49]OGQ15866.1 MAG: hypothetical protein A3D22_02995 [Deltaproteobacteria bacterium RIFCSPHIGHO2_02_FULL_44_53]OGQ28820.1 MAG: hypothetical protein A3D98_01325 [Deltaproteobacteria bacterium RIFCSPHIGHO2_12_FULL_44_21]OGQ32140.1 MAG: hypothetical protein A2979_03450 [Deltaproteobacteria bacterium RIFCSPLOWO2_01_FULL_45_74]OGQ43717.1 MAG: hypothetical protein A3I70_05540 [Deltaproteobacteria bacterium 